MRSTVSTSTRRRAAPLAGPSRQDERGSERAGRCADAKRGSAVARRRVDDRRREIDDALGGDDDDVGGQQQRRQMPGDVVGVAADQVGAGDVSRRLGRGLLAAGRRAPRSGRGVERSSAGARTSTSTSPSGVIGVERMDREAAPRRDAEDLREVFGARRGAGQPDDLVVNVVRKQVLVNVERTQHVDLAHLVRLAAPPLRH